MKNNITIRLLLIVLAFIPMAIKAQTAYVPLKTNELISRHSAGAVSLQPKRLDSIVSIPCDSNSFWGNTGDSLIEFQISGNTVSAIGGMPGIPSTAFAYCNNLNDSSYSPTFYVASGNSLSYYDNGIWITPNLSTSYNLVNAGGYGDYLYFMGFSSTMNFYHTIVRYSNNTIAPVYHDSDFCTATIAVDSSGNVWYFGTSTIADSANYIKVISPAGQVIKQYNISTLYVNGAYGSVLLNNVLYLAVNNTLYPYSFEGDSAISGSPLTIPFVSLIDLATCSPGAPLSQKLSGIDAIDGSSRLRIYPEPAGNQVTISADWSLIGQNATITDITGRAMAVIKLTNTSSTIDLSAYTSGVYFITIDANAGALQKKKLIIAK